MDDKIYTWNVYSKSGELLGQVDAYTKRDAEVLADNYYPNCDKPLHVEMNL